MVPQSKDPRGGDAARAPVAELPAELELWLARALGRSEDDAANADADAAAPRPAALDAWPADSAAARLAARNAILRALGHRFFPGVPTSLQAALIAVRAERYAVAHWPRDVDRAQIPVRHRDTPEEYLWAAFKSGAPMPLGKRELRRILIGVPEAEDAAGEEA